MSGDIKNFNRMDKPQLVKKTVPPLLVQTKFNSPPLWEKLVFRKHLVDKLNRGSSYKLILVTAPAGFGKTTLVAQWISQNHNSTAWLSLDEKDKDVVLFWSYFIQALREIYPHLGSQPLDLLHSSSHPPVEKILTLLINEINRLEKDIFIILDDFHLIKNPAINSSLKYLLDNLPTQFHICILSRTLLSLPLSSFRAKGQLLEVSLNDLRFGFDEVKDFFHKTLEKPNMSQAELQALNQRLEGWVAGMQLASIIINSSPENKSIISNLSREECLFKDYFREEVLDYQSEEVREFLLRTSIVEKMNPSLCDRLAGTENSIKMLKLLEQLNLFLIPLDDQGCWYRYHHLLSRVLRDILKEQEPGVLINLYQEAAFWFKENGFNFEAIHHALKGRDFERAGAWIEEEASRVFKDGKLTVLATWISTLPREILYRRPKIWLYYIWILIHWRKMEEAQATLTEMVNFLKNPGKISQMVDEDSLDFIKREVKMVQGYMAIVKGSPGANDTFMEALQNIREDSMAEKITFNTSSASLLQIETGMWGRLRMAANFYKSTAPAIKKIGDFPSFAVGYVVLAEIHYEIDDWEEGEKYIETALKLGEERIDLGALIPAYITASRIKAGRGEYYAALELLRSLEKKAAGKACHHWFFIIKAHKARMGIKMNDEEAVSDWLNTCQLAVDDEITLLQHYPLVTFLRAIIYFKRFTSALAFSERMAAILEKEGGQGERIEILLLQALCCQESGLLDRGLSSLGQALKMGEEEGYHRVFIDEGRALYKLIKIYKDKQLLLPANQGRDRLINYINRLEKSFIREGKTAGERDTSISALFTRREREVLQLLAVGFTNQAIGESLYISVVTVKSHLKNIYRKLGVKSRGEAIARINQLTLLNQNTLE